MVPKQLVDSTFALRMATTFIINRSAISMLSLSVSILTVLLSTCKAPLQQGNGVGVPIVRVGIAEQKSALEFRVSGRVTFYNRNRDAAYRNRNEGLWRVEVLASRPARFVYRLAVGTTEDRFRAQEIITSLKRKGLAARLETRRRSSGWKLPYLSQSIHQVFLKPEFNSEKTAEAYQARIRKKTGAEIVKVPVSQSKGTLRFTNLGNNTSFESRRSVRLSANVMELLAVDVGTGYHWAAEEKRQYAGVLEFLVDSSGGITVINEVSLEDYLKGVVPSEMPIGFPFEALKAQAVAARGEAASKIDIRHPFEAFDLCDDVHCQVFSGLSRQGEPTDRAVKSTRGIFMVHRHRVIEAFYAGVCGGHTENNDNVWLTDAMPYLTGIEDSEAASRRNSLHQENGVRRWIDARPDVFCNTTTVKIPESLKYSRKYFRWQVTYDRRELEEIIRNKTGEIFGDLVDLIPKRRGVSGRILELEIVGSRKRFVVSRELAIRQALSKNTLYSACFYIKKIGSKKLADRFMIKGAGWGHGVGMCQIGAAMMADSGSKFDEILTHYYNGVSLQLLYN